MKFLSKYLFALTVGFTSLGANAEFVTTDVFNVNDQKGLVDTSTGIEWIKLGQVRNMSISDAQNLLSTTYAGWRLPTQSEVESMMYDIIGITPNTDSTYANLRDARYKDEAIAFHNVFQATRYYSNHRWSKGLYLDDNGNALYTDVYYDTRTGSDKIGDISLGLTTTIDMSSSYYGVYLVSDGGASISSINDPSININNPQSPINNVSTPALLGLFGLSFLVAGSRRKQK